MQFQLTRYEYVKYIEFKTGELQNVEEIRYFKEEGISGRITKKEFRYSWDNTTWTNWNTLSQRALRSISFRDQASFYLEVRYWRNGIGSGNIQRWYLFYESDSPAPPTPTPDASVDADTFGGEFPEYYLNRANHTGPYTDLEISNVPDGSTIGVYHSRTDTSTGTEFFFKRIEGGVGVGISEPTSGKIQISFDGSVAGGGSYENSDPVGATVGGISSGDTFFDGGKTFAETMEAIFYPLSFPTLTNPSSQFSFSPSRDYLQIIGADISLPFRSVFSRGSISPQYNADNGFRSGPGNTVYLNGPDVNLTIGSYPSSPFTYTLGSYEVTQGVQTWTNKWDYDSGVQPYDSKGDPYDSSLAAGTTSTDSLSIEGVYPIYATTVNITSLTEQPLVSMITGNNIELSLVAEPPFGSDRQKIDIPTAWIQDSSLLGIQFYSDLEQGWVYEGGTPTSSLTYWTPTTVSGGRIIEGNVVQYTRYSYSDPTDPGVRQGAVLYRLKFTL